MGDQRSKKKAQEGLREDFYDWLSLLYSPNSFVRASARLVLLGPRDGRSADVSEKDEGRRLKAGGRTGE